MYLVHLQCINNILTRFHVITCQVQVSHMNRRQDIIGITHFVIHAITTVSCKLHNFISDVIPFLERGGVHCTIEPSQ